MELLTVALFPLPNFVLFPRTIVPLRLFEPRYVQLIEQVLRGELKMATGQLRPGWESNYEGAPPVFQTVTLLRVLFHEVTPQHHYNIVAEGVQRARLMEEVPADGLFRKVRIRPLIEDIAEHEREPLARDTKTLVRMAESLGEANPRLRSALTNLENLHLHPGIIADRVAQYVIQDSYERQSLLQETSPLRRVQLVNVRLRAALEALENPSEQPRD